MSEKTFRELADELLDEHAALWAKLSIAQSRQTMNNYRLNQYKPGAWSVQRKIKPKIDKQTGKQLPENWKDVKFPTSLERAAQLLLQYEVSERVGEVVEIEELTAAIMAAQKAIVASIEDFISPKRKR